MRSPAARRLCDARNQWGAWPGSPRAHGLFRHFWPAFHDHPRLHSHARGRTDGWPARGRITLHHGRRRSRRQLPAAGERQPRHRPPCRKLSSWTACSSRSSIAGSTACPERCTLRRTGRSGILAIARDFSCCILTAEEARRRGDPRGRCHGRARGRQGGGRSHRQPGLRAVRPRSFRGLRALDGSAQCVREHRSERAPSRSIRRADSGQNPDQGTRGGGAGDRSWQKKRHVDESDEDLPNCAEGWLEPGEGSSRPPAAVTATAIPRRGRSRRCCTTWPKAG
jgi:hypothetical protein